MKILFVLLHPGYVRNYESAIRLLAERGHKIHLAFNIRPRQAEDRLAEKLSSENSSITFSMAPHRRDRWSGLSRATATLRDYLRYFDLVYVKAVKLRERVETRLPSFIYTFFKILHKIFGFWIIKLADKCLKIIELSIPCRSENIKEFITSQTPDIFLITPLVNFGLDQQAFVECANSLGLKTIFCVASWDNLTNKGLIKGKPDKVIVWNEIQRTEAVELHGIAATDVIVTGAQCYDKWFGQGPSTSREEFCRKIGLLPDRPFLLYLCSSPYISPQEVAFVENWMRKIRSNESSGVGNMGILVRPHPQNAEQWKDVDFSHFENVAIYPRAGANPIDESSKADFFDSLYHCSTVVGINTSAMIEAGIVGKPVFTILAPDFQHSQEGTLHFHYLVQGGLLYVSNNLDEHLIQMNGVLQGDADCKEKIKNFIHSFVRPHGLDTACTPIFVETVENFAKMPAGSTPKRLRLWAYPVRFLLFPLAILVALLVAVRKKKKIDKEKNRARLSILQICRGKVHNIMLAVARYVRRNYFMKKYVIPWLIKEQMGKIPDTSEIIEIEKDIARISSSIKPIIVGPWLSEVGFELLYWIPFLRWAQNEYGLAKERIIVVSRGGAAIWYEGICDRYAEIFDYFTQEQFKDKNQKRIADAGGQKHTDISDFDKEIVEQVKASLNIVEFDWLHPLSMYRMFKFYWKRHYPMTLIEKHTRYQRCQPIPAGEIAKNLPSSYVAVKFYFSECFPDTPENRSFVSDLLATLARKTDVVLLNPGLDIDDHKDYDAQVAEHIHVVTDSMTPHNNLEIQTRIISHASIFVGTYGGFSYLAPFYGVPSVAFYSREEKFLQVHLDVAYRACRVLKYGAFEKLPKNKELLHTDGRAEFIALNVQNLDILQLLAKERENRA